MKGKDFDWQTNEFMLYCRTTQLREKSMLAYEQSLKLLGRWCMDEMGIFTVAIVSENVIRRYIIELQEQKKTHYPERRRNNRQLVSTATINNRLIIEFLCKSAFAFPKLNAPFSEQFHTLQKRGIIVFGMLRCAFTRTPS